MPRVLIALPALPPRTPRGRGLASAIVLAALAFAAHTVRAQPAARVSALTTRLWRFDDHHAATVMVPAAARAGERLPLLLALHGWGESARGVERGAWGWPRDYELGASEAALRITPLSREAFLGFVADSRLRALRTSLAAQPYRGVVVVAPYTPDVLDDPDRATRYARWVAQTLLPRARRELPVLSTREATGIDGISLGGLLALEVGFAHPESFGVVGAMQAAVRGRVARVLGRYRASPGRPTQRVRLLSSSQDHLRPDVLALHRALRARAIEHELRIIEGPHDYAFNRGPGGLEMLLFHDRALRGLPSP